MKKPSLKFFVFTATAFLMSLCGGLSQGFVNLNFDSTTLTNNGPPNTVATSVGLPGWTAFVGGTAQSTILYNNATVGSSGIAIWGNYSNEFVSFSALQGKFSAELRAGPANASISQTGIIPLNAYTILFEAAEFYTPTNFSVTLNGQPISVVPLSSTANYTVFGGDISAFTGQTANLTFTCISAYSSGIPLLALELDNIQFSTTPLPEPSTLALTAIGTLLLGCRRWKK